MEKQVKPVSKNIHVHQGETQMQIFIVSSLTCVCMQHFALTLFLSQFEPKFQGETSLLTANKQCYTGKSPAAKSCSCQGNRALQSTSLSVTGTDVYSQIS